MYKYDIFYIYFFLRYHVFVWSKGSQNNLLVSPFFLLKKGFQSVVFGGVQKKLGRFKKNFVGGGSQKKIGGREEGPMRGLKLIM